MKTMFQKMRGYGVFFFLTICLISNSQAQYKESEWQDRDKWQKPEEIIKAMALEEGSKVADIGANEGYMTVKLAKEVGNTGAVYAVDISKNKLNKLRKNLDKRDINNVNIIHSKEDNPMLPNVGLDAVVIIDSYHEFEDYKDMLRHIKTALKPGGRLVMSEAISKSRRKKSREDQVDRHEISIKYVKEELQAAGFEIDSEKDPLLKRKKDNDEMWLLVGRVPKQSYN